MSKRDSNPINFVINQNNQHTFGSYNFLERYKNLLIVDINFYLVFFFPYFYLYNDTNFFFTFSFLKFYPIFLLLTASSRFSFIHFYQQIFIFIFIFIKKKIIRFYFLMVLKIIQLLIVAIFRQKQQLSYYQLFYLYYFFFSIVWITHKIFITDINSFFFFFFIYLFFILPWRTTFPKIHNFIYIFIYLLIYKIRSIMFNFGFTLCLILATT